MLRPICHVLNSYIYASFVPLFHFVEVTFSLRVIPIGVYSSITYTDFVITVFEFSDTIIIIIIIIIAVIIIIIITIITRKLCL